MFYSVCFSINTNAQNIIVQQNNSPIQNVTDPNIRYINGVPSTLDVGGVENHIGRDIMEAGITNYYYVYYVEFTNYNQSAVTVLYEISYYTNESKYKSGSLVLKPGESKRVDLGRKVEVEEVFTITRKL